MKISKLSIIARTLPILIAMMSAFSCTDEGMDNGNGGVKFVFSTGNVTRSAISPDENLIKDVNIAIYRLGVLHTSLFLEGKTDTELELDRGEYSVYAVGNIGEETAFPVYEAFMPRWRYRISSTADLKEKGMAFTAADTIYVNKGGGVFTLKMNRMIARCGFRFDASALEGMRVKSVKLRQTALDMAPFGSAGSVPEKLEDIGDYASEMDLAALRKGETVYFYCLENDRGELLPENKDIWGKVPDKIPGLAEKCTFVEVTAEISHNPAGLTGEVTYRFYLGKNTTTDFSVERNTDYTISLTTSEDGLGRTGWMIDTSGLGIDPLFNFNPPEMPEYVGQWARISFPDACRSRTVVVSSGDKNIIVGEVSEGVDSIYLENGALLLYAPQASAQDLYVYMSTRTPVKTSPVSEIALKSAERQASMQINCGIWPKMVIADKESGAALSSATVNEDGHGVCRAEILLKDNSGAILSPASFATPDEGIAAALGYSIDGNGDVMGQFARDFINTMQTGALMRTSLAVSIVAGKSAGIQLLRPGSFSGNAAAEAIIYGFAQGGEVVAAGKPSPDGGMGIICKVNCTVNKAFPNQGYRGAIHNTQLDICSASREGHTEIHTIDIYGGVAGSENAQWYLFRTDPALGTDPGGKFINNILSGHNNLQINNFQGGKLEIALLPPEPDETASPTKKFFACGAFCLRGTVTNPYSLKRFNANYLIDIILDISVTAQLDFLPGYLGFYFVPYNVHYASADYSYSWKNNLPVVIKPLNFLNEASIADDDRVSSCIPRNRPVGLVPVTMDNLANKGSLEYRTKYCNNNFGNTNAFPFYEGTGAIATSMLAGTFMDNDGNYVTTDISRILSFKICPLNEDGSIMAQLDKLLIDRNNYASYPAFEGFYNITRRYENFKSTGSSLDNVGKYVIEASEKAQSLKTPFYSDDL